MFLEEKEFETNNENKRGILYFSCRGREQVPDCTAILCLQIQIYTLQQLFVKYDVHVCKLNPVLPQKTTTKNSNNTKFKFKLKIKINKQSKKQTKKNKQRKPQLLEAFLNVRSCIHLHGESEKAKVLEIFVINTHSQRHE